MYIYSYNPERSVLKEDDTMYTVFSPVLGGIISICKDKWGRKIPNKDDVNAETFAEYVGCHETLKYIQNLKNKTEAFHMLFIRNTSYNLIWSLVPDLSIQIHNHNITTLTPLGLMINNSNQSYLTHTGNGDVTRMGEVLKFMNDELQMSGNTTETFLTTDPNNYNQYYNFTSIPNWNPRPPYNPSHLFYFGLYNLVDDSINNPQYFEDGLPTLYINILKRRVETDFCGYYDVKGIKTMRYCINISPQLDTCNSSWATPNNETLTTPNHYYPPNCQYNSYGPSGVLNMSAQYGNAPVYITLPYFINASYYEQELPNMNLNILDDTEYDNYITWFDVEPQTGAILAANATMQLASTLNPINNSIFENLKENIMVPMYMIGYSAEFPDGLANSFTKNMNLASTLYYVSVYTGYVCLPLLIIYSWFVCYTIGYRKENNDEYNTFNNKKSSIIN